MKIVEVKHPLVKHKLGLMREAEISTKDFRELANEIGSLLTYEATKDLEIETVEINGWSGNKIPVERIKGKKSYCCTNFTCRFRNDGWRIRAHP